MSHWGVFFIAMYISLVIAQLIKFYLHKVPAACWHIALLFPIVFIGAIPIMITYDFYRKQNRALFISVLFGIASIGVFFYNLAELVDYSAETSYEEYHRVAYWKQHTRHNVIEKNKQRLYKDTVAAFGFAK